MVTIIKSEAAPEIIMEIIMLLITNHMMKNLQAMEGMQVTADLCMSNRNIEEATMERGAGLGYASVVR